MNIEIVAFVVIPIIAWCLIVHTLLYRDRERVYSAWSELHSLLEKRISFIQIMTNNSDNVEEIDTRLKTIDNNAYLPELALQHKKLSEALNSEKFSQLYTEELRDLDKSIELHTEWYNAASKNLNVRLQSFPDMLIGKIFGFRAVEYFAEKKEEKQDSPLV